MVVGITYTCSGEAGHPADCAQKFPGALHGRHMQRRLFMAFGALHSSIQLQALML